MSDVIQQYNAFVNGLSPAEQAAVITFTRSLIALTPLMVWEKIRRHRNGGGPPNRNKKAEFMIAMAGFAAVYYLQGRFAWLAEIIAWPDRHFRMWREHGFAMVMAFLAAGYAAKALTALYAALFLRRAPQSYGGGQLGFPEVPGLSWVMRTRTYHMEDEQ